MNQGPIHEIETTINGQEHRETVPARMLLIHFLRDVIGLRGPKVGCDTGNCGACTVRVDGKTVKSCMVLAVQADGLEVRTVEAMAEDGELTPLQRAFHEQHALQCGYCTPGMLMSAEWLLERNPTPTEFEVRRGLKGNICRCTAYVNIVKAVQAIAGEREVGA